MKPNLYKVPLIITVDVAGLIQHPTIEVSVLAYDEEEASLVAMENTKVQSPSYTGGQVKLIRNFNN